MFEEIATNWPAFVAPTPVGESLLPCRRLGLHPFEYLLRPLHRGLNVLADVVLADHFLKFCLGSSLAVARVPRRESGSGPSPAVPGLLPRSHTPRSQIVAATRLMNSTRPGSYPPLPPPSGPQTRSRPPPRKPLSVLRAASSIRPAARSEIPSRSRSRFPLAATIPTRSKRPSPGAAPPNPTVTAAIRPCINLLRL